MSTDAATLWAIQALPIKLAKTERALARLDRYTLDRYTLDRYTAECAKQTDRQLASGSPVEDARLLLLELGFGQDASLKQVAELRQLGELISGFD
jgi:hypothetical protein